MSLFFQTTVPRRGQGDLQREGLPVPVLRRTHVSGTKGHPGFQQYVLSNKHIKTCLKGRHSLSCNTIWASTGFIAEGKWIS